MDGPKKITKKRAAILIAVLVISPFLLWYGIEAVFIQQNILYGFHDVDRKPDGNTLAITGIDNTIMNPLREAFGYNRTICREITPEGETVWSYEGSVVSPLVPHEIEVLENGHILFADTQNELVFEVNYPNTDVVWTWDTKLMDWEGINPEWDEDHYFNNPTDHDWAHLNDIDIKDYGIYKGLMLSFRNFNLIMELNYTAIKTDPYNADNVLWYYGVFEDTSILNRQHNPEYLENGNILISDSINKRVIEVNMSTKEVVWTYDENLGWVRDAEEMPDGRFLITDSKSVFILNKTIKERVWEFRRDIIRPYESDYLDNGNVLIGGTRNTFIYEVNLDGEIVWSYGAPKMFYFSLGLFILVVGISVFLLWCLKGRWIEKKGAVISLFIIIGVFTVYMFEHAWINSVVTDFFHINFFPHM